MSLDRRDIVSAFKNAIKHGDTIARKNVHSYRVNPNWFENLPAVNVYPSHESAGEIFNDAPLSFKRRLQISIECVVSGRKEDEASELLDKLMAQVEHTIGYKYSFDKEFRCLFNKYFPVDVEFDFDESGKQIIAGGKINYEVEYISEAVMSQPVLDDLERMSSTYTIDDSTTKTESLNEIPQ